MELGDDDIKKMYSSKLSSFQPEVPSCIWDKIEERLEVALPVATPSKFPFKEKIIKLTFWVSGVAAMIVAVLLLLPHEHELNSSHTFSMSYDKPDRSLIKNMNKDSVVPNTILQPLLAKQNTPQSKAKAYSSNLSDSQSGITEVVSSENNHQHTDFSYTDPNMPLNTSSIVELSENDPIVVDDELRQDLQTKIEEFVDIGKRQQGLLDEIAQRDDTEKLQLGMKGGGGLFSSSRVKNDLNSMNPKMGNMSLRSVQAKMTHNQPINFGISISKQLSRRMSVESGLTYTYLSSTVGADELNKFTQRDKQYFHYLGIPLSLNYTLVEIRRFKVYSSLGAMIQMDFYGRRTSDTYLGRLESQTYVKDKISQKNPQFSILGGFGVSYPIYDKLRLYTNLGGAYYFDANNQYETIYSDKKWLFNLDIGIKFEF